MKFIEALKTKWNTLSNKEKAKMIVGTVCDIGSTFLMSALGNKLIEEDDGLAKRLTMKVSLWGLGMCAGELATNQLNSLIDCMPEKEEDDA